MDGSDTKGGVFHTVSIGSDVEQPKFDHDATLAYVQQQGINTLCARLLSELVNEKPSDPLGFLVSVLSGIEAESTATEGSLAGAFAERPSSSGE